MALTTVSDLWVPEIWINSTREKQSKFPSILNTRAVVKNSTFDAIASGAGRSANVPMFRDITDQEDEVQVENTAPVTTNEITADPMVAVMTNRVWSGAGTALSAQLSGGDPIEEMTLQLAQGRDKRRQARIIATLRGAFGAAGARNGAAALSAVRLGGTTDEPFDEQGVDATSDQKFSPDMFIDAQALLGELENDLAGGVIVMHSAIKARLKKLDEESFKEGVESGLGFTITTYRGVPIVVTDSLVRAGTTDGFVFDTYICGRATIAYGEKAQVGGTLNNPIADVASLNVVVDASLNNTTIYDRTRELVHVNGLKWTGTPSNANNGPSNAELQTAGNWSLVYQTASRVGAVCIRTNG